MAIATVELVLWDLKARLAELPLCRVLGMTHDRMAVYEPQAIPRVKMKLRTVRGSASDATSSGCASPAGGGARAELYVDANSAYGPTGGAGGMGLRRRWCFLVRRAGFSAAIRSAVARNPQHRPTPTTRLRSARISDP